MTILNAYTKKVWKLIEGTTYTTHYKVESQLVEIQNLPSLSSVAVPRGKESSLLYYLYTAKGRRDVFISFPRALG